MKTKRNVNIATVIALFLIAVVTSPEALKQLIVFIALLAIVFGRDSDFKEAACFES